MLRQGAESGPDRDKILAQQGRHGATCNGTLGAGTWFVHLDPEGAGAAILMICDTLRTRFSEIDPTATNWVVCAVWVLECGSDAQVGVVAPGVRKRSSRSGRCARIVRRTGGAGQPD